MWHSSLCSCLLLVLTMVAAPAASELVGVRERLPDYSQGQAGRLGPFLWARAADAGGDARFCDSEGRPQQDGDHLWLYQFTRLKRTKHPVQHGQLERNNLELIEPGLAFDVQFKDLLAHCPQPHNFKLVIGYKAPTGRFQHGDNADLAHLVDADRICLYIPVRKRRGSNAYQDENYFFNTVYAGQSICVIEFKAGEMIEYEWFRGRGNLDEHVLYDLAPLFADHEAWTPGIKQPIFRFTIGEGGAWTVLIEQDGTDGLAGGLVDGDWDHRITQESEGAKPATVQLDPATAVWSLSTFSPGGTPEETSECLLGLDPIDPLTGESAAWPDRSLRLRTVSLEEALAGRVDRSGGKKKKTQPSPSVSTAEPGR